MFALTARRRVMADEANPHGYRPTAAREEFTIPVRGMAPGPTEEAAQQGRDTARAAWTLYCPAGVLLDGSEEVQVDGEWFEIDGESRDWTRGPWHNPTAGVVVQLLRRRG